MRKLHQITTLYYAMYVQYIKSDYNDHFQYNKYSISDLISHQRLRILYGKPSRSISCNCALDINEDLRAVENETDIVEGIGERAFFFYIIKVNLMLSLFLFFSLLENMQHFKLTISMFQLKKEIQIHYYYYCCCCCCYRYYYSSRRNKFMHRVFCLPRN